MHACSASGDMPGKQKCPGKTFVFPIYITIGYIITNLWLSVLMLGGATRMMGNELVIHETFTCVRTLLAEDRQFTVSDIHRKMAECYLKVRPHRQKFSRTTWYNMVVWHKTCRGCSSVDGMGDVCRATFYVVRPRWWTAKCQSTSKEILCDIMVSQRYCVLSDVIWIYFCHFLRCSRTKCIKKNRRCVDVGRTTFCTTTIRFMSHNLVAQSCMTKLLSVWTHLNAD